MCEVQVYSRLQEKWVALRLCLTRGDAEVFILLVNPDWKSRIVPVEVGRS